MIYGQASEKKKRRLYSKKIIRSVGTGDWRWRASLLTGHEASISEYKSDAIDGGKQVGQSIESVRGNLKQSMDEIRGVIK